MAMSASYFRNITRHTESKYILFTISQLSKDRFKCRGEVEVVVSGFYSIAMVDGDVEYVSDTLGGIEDQIAMYLISTTLENDNG